MRRHSLPSNCALNYHRNALVNVFAQLSKVFVIGNFSQIFLNVY